MKAECSTLGFIAYINRDREFGFVRHGENEKTFFHFDNVTDLSGPEILRRGTWVEFFIKRNTTHKGKTRAFNVKRVINY